MKKKVLIMFVCLLTLSIGCSKDDKAPTEEVTEPETTKPETTEPETTEPETGTIPVEINDALVTDSKGQMPIFNNLFENLQVNPNLDSYFSKEFYEQFFPERGRYFIPSDAPANPPYSNLTQINANPELGKKYYSYENFKAAVDFLFTKGGGYEKLFNEGTPLDIKREVACMLAHIKQETAGLAFNVESWYHPIKDTHTYNGYQGRGPKQLSHDYNYRAFSEFAFGDASILLNGGKYSYDGKEYEIGPGAIAVDGRLAWLSSLWFLLTPNTKPSMHDIIIGKWKPSDEDIALGRVPGFGMTTNVINGAVEACGSGGDDPRSANRIKYYKEVLSTLNINDPREMSCKNMAHY